ncbi:hypothetical protein RLOC_00013970 [Lonchura striata]|uniref:Uncharacterized protein n=1 Tax=Lonchura striata TaxID=40157 RepID=A0A218VCC3_9PASE|nr:hypothetical protein RLOC_00013970 [Lonchura striata domestica]
MLPAYSDSCRGLAGRILKECMASSTEEFTVSYILSSSSDSSEENCTSHLPFIVKYSLWIEEKIYR